MALDFALNPESFKNVETIDNFIEVKDSGALKVSPAEFASNINLVLTLYAFASQEDAGLVSFMVDLLAGGTDKAFEYLGSLFIKEVVVEEYQNVVCTEEAVSNQAGCICQLNDDLIYLSRDSCISNGGKCSDEIARTQTCKTI